MIGLWKKMPISAYLTNVRLVGLLVVSILLFGIVSFFTLPRRLNPEIQIPIVSVVTTYPGAGPTEVEELVTIPLENKLSNAKNLQKISSTSSENVSVITAEFTSSTTPDDARQEVQKLVGEVTDLPENSLAPSVRELDFEDVPVWNFVLTTSGSRASLERVTTLLKEELEASTKIDRLVVNGQEKQEIQVLFSPEKIAQYGIGPLQLQSLISTKTGSAPAGKVNTENNSYALSISENLSSIEDLRTLQITSNGQEVLLGDIATIQLRSAAEQKRSYVTTTDYTNQSAVSISVYKTRSADISDAQETAAKIADEVLSEFDGTLELISIENVAADIDDQFTDLFENFASTILLVFATLFLFVGLKQALVASLSIPLTFLISFITMNVTGQTLNFLTLFSLLLGLGLLVDDAIVIISAVTAYYRTKKFTPKQTGLLVWRDFLVPIWTTTITTVWAFIPLLLAGGIIGEFIKPIPIVVSSTLLASTTVAVLVTLPLMMVLLKFKPPKRVVVGVKIFVAVIAVAVALRVSFTQPLGVVIAVVTSLLVWLTIRWRAVLGSYVPVKVKKVSHTVSLGGLVSMEGIRAWYANTIRSILTSKTRKKQILLAVCMVSLFSYLLLPLGFVKNEFFPKSDTEILYVTVELPTGTKLDQTEKKALGVASSLQTISGVELITTTIGEANRSSGSNSGSGDNVASLTVRLVPASERQQSSEELSVLVKERIDALGLQSRVFAESGGPPAGSDVTIKIIGKELPELQRIADTLIAEMEQTEGLRNIDRSIKQGNSKLVFKADPAALSQLSVSENDIALWTRTAVSGFEVGEVDFGLSEQETPIRYQMSTEILTPEQLASIEILTNRGSVPLFALGSVGLESSPSRITREDGNRTLSITADVAPGFNAGEVNASLLEFADTLELERGYSFATGGANEENQRSVQSILQAMLLSLILIIATMVVQLGSFRQSLLVVLVIPLAVSGVFILFSVTNTPLSFPALIGVLALFGIVVNNSIMVVDKINQNLAIGMKQTDAITDAAANRLEPIFFSSLTTIIGLVPITLSDPIWQGLGGAIISGLLFSGMIMLFIIPVLYSYFYPKKYL